MVNGIATRHSGFPTDIFANAQSPVFNSFNVPDRIVGPSTQVSHLSPNGWFNPYAFASPGVTYSNSGIALTNIGNSSRRVARGPHLSNMDFPVFWEVNLAERYKVQFRAEFFNLTNTPAFNLPGASHSELDCIGNGQGTACNAGNSNFGKISDGTATGRQIQFGLKFLFCARRFVAKPVLPA